MIQPRVLKRIRPGNVKVNEQPINMNVQRELINPQNTLQSLHTLQTKVSRFCTDVDGKILADNDAGLVASGMMPLSYPIFLLGQWDKESGYKAGQNIVPPNGVSKFLVTFINGYGYTSNNVVTPFSGNNSIQALLKPGDIVTVYTDSLSAPNYFVWIVVSSNVSGIASILSNLGTSQNDHRLMRLYCYEVNIVAPDPLQLNESWHYVNVDNLGNVKDNQIAYSTYNNPFNAMREVLTIPTEFEFNQYIGIYLYLVSSRNNLQINFNLNIVE